jgi:hypothetical protein
MEDSAMALNPPFSQLAAEMLLAAEVRRYRDALDGGHSISYRAYFFFFATFFFATFFFAFFFAAIV